MKQVKLDERNINNLLFPVFYDSGILFRSKNIKNRFYLYKENSVKILSLEEINEVEYPENLEELMAFKNALTFINLRGVIANTLNEEFKEFEELVKEIILKLEIYNEEINLNKLNVRL